MNRALPLRRGIVLAGLVAAAATVAGCHFVSRVEQPRFDIQSVGSGRWSDATTWEPQRRPRAGDRVLVQPGHEVVYDVADTDVIRSIAVAGTLTFARDRDTELNVGVVTVYGAGHVSPARPSLLVVALTWCTSPEPGGR